MVLEIKFGYGFDLVSECKMLWVICCFGECLLVIVCSICLVVYVLLLEYVGCVDDYIEYICLMMFFVLVGEGLVDVVDVFCEYLVFFLVQVEWVFIVVCELGLLVKLYVEQLFLLYGFSLVVCYWVLLVDYLEYMIEDDVCVMGEVGIVVVLLLGVFYLLCEIQLLLIDVLCWYGVVMVIVSDFNFGILLVLLLCLMLNMVCILFCLILEEVLVGVILYVVWVLGLEVSYGSLEVGKLVDFVVWDIECLVELVYWLGGDLLKCVICYVEEVYCG